MRKGSHFTEEQRQNSRAGLLKWLETHRGESHPNFSIVRSIENRKAISEGTKKAMAALPQEVKDKIRDAPQAYKSHPVPEKQKQRLREVALASRDECSTRVSGSKNPMFGRCGELNPNWCGGYEGNYPVEYWRIRDYILKRDDYTCQLCFLLAVLVHHIDWNTWHNEEENLVGFCKSCNALPREKQHQEYLKIRASKNFAIAEARTIFG